MAKPSSLPRWADVGGLTTEPSSGLKDTGFVAGTPIVSRYVNWILNLIYQWLNYWESEERVLIIPASEGAISNGDWTTTNYAEGAWLSKTSGGANIIEYSISARLPVGARIKAVRVYGKEGNAGGETYIAKLFKKTLNSTAAQLSTTKTSGTTNANTTVEWTSADAGLASGYVLEDIINLYCQVTLAQTSAGAEVTSEGIRVLYTNGG